MKENSVLFKIQRYQPESAAEPAAQAAQPYWQEMTLDEAQISPGMMLLDALKLLREQDSTLSFRSSCQEGVCGSDAMQVNGRNRLSCITPLAELRQPIELMPVPGLPILRDLIVDMTLFFDRYAQANPTLNAGEFNPEQEHLQSPEDRAKLDGLYECILCACCSTSCPSFWWHPDQFLGPAALLAAERVVIDSRDIQPKQRLDALSDPYQLHRCRGIQQCTASCPKGLDPSRAIRQLKHQQWTQS
ncbi:succinate dehydrogenase iron-sulfur subunit [Thiomicrospira cyclica]|uniref:Succinate dehydrogenase iron-sulfur subunit n=1 Tax=Thiomicrospira cyclica (strain DSM 14477 / JCM 11371 / ALM1) TaxID=717773 RepID=F6DCR4_THICA|nr:succinate dehydrogenase iron-sulfur subunit [Thiomicrospira cyclica]AEG31650.1 succinate dehydrogenase and fumarate reductase iron-sulfur protein [Thiomicrospira cyclica ALM1]